MAGILWLASYPKSGNTWLRIFLGNLFNDADTPLDINKLGVYSFGEMSPDLYERVSGRVLATMSDRELHLLRPQVHRLLFGLRPDTAIVKTHCAIAVQDDVPTVTPEVTAGAIYVVRNPLDLVLSYADHYGLTTAQAIEAINSQRNRIQTSPTAVWQFLCDWSGHVQSWTEAPGLKLHLVRYEDLLEDPYRHFGAVLAFMGLEVTKARLRRSIKFSALPELQRQEGQRGFREKSRNAERFFRQGTAGAWREALTAAEVDAVVSAHEPMMRRYGYLP
jgi:Sulfotransferase domain